MSRKHITLSNRIPPFLLFALFLVVIINGCSTYQSVTGYFNTYYNAQKLFNEAERELQGKTKRNADSSYFVEYQPSAQTTAKFDKVIEKCSKIIQLHPQSNLVDDALLMIGKAYVYNNEYESAEKKFEEFFETFPTSTLRFEAKLWYAKAEYFLGDEQRCRELLRELVSEIEGEGEDDIALEALLHEGQIHYDNHEYPQAIEVYSRAVAGAGDGYLLAFSQYYIGKCYEQLMRYSDAATAYQNVREFEPDLALRFRAILNYGRMLAAAKQYETALDTFDELRDISNKPEEKAEIDLETATTFTLMGDTAQGFEIYRLMDTTYKKTDALAKAYYRRAVLYEEVYKDFRVAYKFYDNARNEFPNSAITSWAKKKADYFERYFRGYRNMARYDSLYRLALLPDSSKPLRKGTDSLHRGDTTKHILPQLGLTNKDSLSLFTADSFVDTAVMIRQEDDKQDGHQKEESDEHALSLRDESDVVQDSTLEEDVELEEVPRRRGGRDAEMQEKATPKDEPRRQTPATNVSNTTQLSADTIHYLITQQRFELAGLLFLELNYLDSAAYWYETIYHDTGETPFKPRALYALAEVHRAMGDTLKVDSLYDELMVKYGETEFGKQIKKNIGIHVEQEEVDSGLIAYEVAAQKLSEGDTQEALRMFKKILQRHPNSACSPKTYYVLGWIYESILVNNDSAAMWYKLLIEHYPKSLYADAVIPKVAVKDDSTSLSKYVKIKQIQLLSRESTAQRARASSTTTGTQRDEGSATTRGRGRGKDVEEDEEPEEIDIERDEEDIKDSDDEE
jgi:tetratricopeptide (TPR) repeat protein